MNKYIFSAIFLTICVLFFYTGTVHAQQSASTVAKGLPLEIETDDGDMICLIENKLVKCSSPYSSEIVGVVSKSPSAVLEFKDEADIQAISSDGIARVRVSTSNGAIAEGDLITSSEIAGVGQKATENGYVLGFAMENYDSVDNSAISTIIVGINIHPAAKFSNARSNLLQVLRRGVTAPIFEPLASLRYILAALIILVSFSLGFLYFGRVSRSGVEAIGRNPMAAKTIQFSILMHIVVTTIIVLAGLFISYLILIL